MCRKCTGHLALLEGESPARLKNKTQNQKQQPKANKQTRKQGQSLAKPRLIGSCKGETNLRKSETKGQLITQKGLSVLNAHVPRFKTLGAGMRSVAKHCIAFAAPFALGTLPGDPGIVQWKVSLQKRLGRPTCRFIACTCEWEAGMIRITTAGRSPVAPNKKGVPSFQQCHLLMVHVCTQVVFHLQPVGLPRTI